MHFFPSITLNKFYHCFLACRVSADKSPDSPMGIPLYVNWLFSCSFSHAPLNTLYLSTIFAILITMCLGVVCFSCGSAGKESACNEGDLGSIPELGRSCGEGKGYPLQYSGLENSMDCYSPRGHKESSRLTFTFTFLSLWCCVLWIHPLWDSLCFLELDVYFLFHVREIFSCHLFKYIFCLFFYLVLLLGSL